MAAQGRFTVLISLTQTCYSPAHISTPIGAYNACCHYRRKALLENITITSCSVLILWMSEPVATWRHCSSWGLEPATLRLRVLRTNLLRYHGFSSDTLTLEGHVLNLVLLMSTCHFLNHIVLVMTNVDYGIQPIMRCTNSILFGANICEDYDAYLI